ncbi:MAG: hypothetical protein ACRDCA_13395 [Serratia sp. (in: enterobacteria)]|uniref:hypothetical protein n=1 Tax=Serratia sp. (in: enterobacteria) TaxID=616 RepID=UPI003F396A0B
MNTHLELLEELRKRTTDFIYPLTLEGVVVEVAFSNLLSFTENMTKIFKSEDFLPKSILRELLLTICAMKTHSQKINSDEFYKMTFKIEKNFNLIIAGESIDDRKPRVPRII